MEPSLASPGKIAPVLPEGTATPMISLVGANSAESILTAKLKKSRKSPGYAVLDQLNDPEGADIQLGVQFPVNT